MIEFHAVDLMREQISSFCGRKKIIFCSVTAFTPIIVLALTIIEGDLIAIEVSLLSEGTSQARGGLRVRILAFSLFCRRRTMHRRQKSA